ncbi:MAG: Secretion system C-terminal sorting domain [Bacteroidota bacterium]|jgi:hypothetical protein
MTIINGRTLFILTGLTACWLGGLQTATGQISILASDIDPIGLQGFQSRDSFPDSSIQPGGPGQQTWDFSALKDQSSDTLTALVPAGTPFSDIYPDADIAVRRNNDLFVYLRKEDNQLQLLGITGKLLYQTFTVEGSLTFDPQQTILAFPAVWDAGFTESVRSTIQVPGSVIGSTFDSLRLRSHTIREVVYDAYGNLKTPAGEYETLRARETESGVDSVYILSGGIWFPLQASEKDTVVYYNWWTNQGGLGFPLVQVESDPSGAIKLVSWLRDVITAERGTSSPASILEVFPNPARSELTVFFPEGKAGDRLSLLDLSGKEVLRQPLAEGRSTYPLSGLAPGGHLVVITDASGNLRAFRKIQVVR